MKPRLEGLATQAAAAREAAVAQARLEVLRGSIVWEEWREARDAHRKASGQKQSLEKRLEEAVAQAEKAETEFRAGRAEMESAQDRRLARQQSLGALRLELSTAEHTLAMTRQNLANLGETATAVESELRELDNRAEAAAAVAAQLERELGSAEAALAAVPDDPFAPALPDPEAARKAIAAAEHARREVAQAVSAVAAIRTRRQFLEETADGCGRRSCRRRRSFPISKPWLSISPKERLGRPPPPAELVRIRAEQEGLEALWPSPAPGQVRSATSSGPIPATRLPCRRCSDTWSRLGSHRTRRLPAALWKGPKRSGPSSFQAVGQIP